MRIRANIALLENMSDEEFQTHFGRKKDERKRNVALTPLALNPGWGGLSAGCERKSAVETKGSAPWMGRWSLPGVESGESPEAVR